jgi:hypothetical protein
LDQHEVRRPPDLVIRITEDTQGDRDYLVIVELDELHRCGASNLPRRIVLGQVEQRRERSFVVVPSRL